MSDFELSEDNGDDVFGTQNDAVEKLIEIIEKPEEFGAFDNINDIKVIIEEKILKADEVIASGAIENLSNIEYEKISKANIELENAKSAQKRGLYDKAVEHFFKAWEITIKSEIFEIVPEKVILKENSVDEFEDLLSEFNNFSKDPKEILLENPQYAEKQIEYLDSLHKSLFEIQEQEYTKLGILYNGHFTNYENTLIQLKNANELNNKYENLHQKYLDSIKNFKDKLDDLDDPIYSSQVKTATLELDKIETNFKQNEKNLTDRIQKQYDYIISEQENNRENLMDEISATSTKIQNDPILRKQFGMLLILKDDIAESKLKAISYEQVYIEKQNDFRNEIDKLQNELDEKLNEINSKKDELREKGELNEKLAEFEAEKVKIESEFKEKWEEQIKKLDDEETKLKEKIIEESFKSNEEFKGDFESISQNIRQKWDFNYDIMLEYEEEERKLTSELNEEQRKLENEIIQEEKKC